MPQELKEGTRLSRKQSIQYLQNMQYYKLLFRLALGLQHCAS